MPVRLAVTEGTAADYSLALPLIEGIEAEYLLADKAYDTNEIIAAATELGMDPVIPPKSNRKEKRDYDRALYKLRHLVERVPGVQAVARDSDPLCQEDSVIPGRLPTPGSDDLEQTLLTTPRRAGWQDSTARCQGFSAHTLHFGAAAYSCRRTRGRRFGKPGASGCRCERSRENRRSTEPPSRNTWIPTALQGGGPCRVSLRQHLIQWRHNRVTFVLDTSPNISADLRHPIAPISARP